MRFGAWCCLKPRTHPSRRQDNEKYSTGSMLYFDLQANGSSGAAVGADQGLPHQKDLEELSGFSIKVAMRRL